MIDRARPPRVRPASKRGSIDTCCRQFDSSGKSRPAAANDGNFHPKTQVFQAIQILRTGVSAMRWCSTWKFFAFDFVEQGTVNRRHDKSGALILAVYGR
jgi:hypothetical protein